MSLAPGTRLGPYEIQSTIGAGGMGEVYKARDTRLDRVVAIKVLTDVLAGDPQFRDRFEREARTISQLKHPNICTLHDIGRQDGPSTGSGQAIDFLVMEFLDGETVGARLAALQVKGKALGLDEGLTIATQVADGLAAAHAAGIVHRDLKPGNVMLTATGAKLLDFGLAKSGGRLPGAPGTGQAAIHLADLSAPMTMTSPLTSQGAIVGTVQYMAPEQLEGKEADTRSDIFAFGALVHEMLTGARAFQGKTLVSVMASILEHEPPPLSSANASVPASLTRVVQKCLAKDPNRRWQSAADLADELRWIADEVRAGVVRPKPDAADQKTSSLARRRPWLIVAASLVAGVALAGAAMWIVARMTPVRAPDPVRFAIVPPAAQALAVQSSIDRDIVISADGTRIVFRAGSGQPGLAVRALGELDARVLTGTTPARSPFISPDGRWIAFFSGSDLKKVSMTGGPPVTLCQVIGGPRGGSWGPDDVIVFATNATDTGLLSIPAGGGEPRVLTKADTAHGENDHWFPSVLPGGRGILFTVIAGGGGGGGAENAQIAVLDRQTGRQKTLIRGGSQAEYVEPSTGSSQAGYLIYAVAGTLRAARFDLARLEVIGDAVPVLEQVQTNPTGAAEFALSRGGTLVYVPGSGLGGVARSLVWVNRDGREEPIKAPPRPYSFLQLSPDRTRAALDVRDQERDIWVWDFVRETLSRLTLDPASDFFPVWTPDGQRIAFQSSREGGAVNIFWQPADGTGTAEHLTKSPNSQQPSAFSPDGTRLVFNETAPKTNIDIGMLALNPNGPAGESRTDMIVQTTFNEGNADVSPDGHWIAYQSNDSGRLEVFVRPFPKTDGGHWQISTNGGGRPIWSRDGRELFYIDLSNALMAVAVRTSPMFAAGNPVKLFDGLRYSPSITGRTYDVSADGKRFLMIKDSGATDQTSSAPPSLVVVEHWFEELKARVPTK